MSQLALAQHTLERAGCALHYGLAGPEDHPLVVLTHGATMDHRMFTAQIAALAPHYRVLAWDVRGHGRSQPLNPDFSLRQAVDDLLALLDKLGYQQAALVGHSMGGYISQELTFRHPERVIALVAIDCTCLTLRHTGFDRLGMAWSPAFMRLYPYTLFKRQAARRITVTPEAEAYVYGCLQRLSRQDFITIWGAVMRSVHHEPGYHLPCPLLITYGQYNGIGLGTIKRQTGRWARRDSRCRYVMVPNAGHNPHQENPGFFNPLLLEFLSEHLKS